MDAQEAIGVVALMLVVGLVSDFVASVLRLPRMVVLLAAGVLLGPYVVPALRIPLEATGAQVLLALGVSVILFYGGLGLSLHVVGRVAVGLVLLAVPGVFLTALITGAGAALAFGLPFEAALLVGAIVAPTDPAILIPLFERLGVRPKIATTVVAESALNDATGAVLVLALGALVTTGRGSVGEVLGEFLLDLAVSTGLGVAFGIAAAVAVSSRRAGVFRETPTIAVLMVVTAAFFSIESAGGSGYMGAFIAGLIVGNLDVLRLGMHIDQEREMYTFIGVVKDLAVIFVFVTLGANLPLERIADNAVPALAVLAVLVLVARPLTVLTCLGLDRRGGWEPREIAFLAWTRETGVVPAALLGVLIAEGVPYEAELNTVVALAVVVTLVVQSTTKPWLARRLRLLEQ
ncbi:MAG: cation:proton antiporter [Actinomycetota bacterium]|nr:cation:proton antiporter [Actinomycetota bacterium]